MGAPAPRARRARPPARPSSSSRTSARSSTTPRSPAPRRARRRPSWSCGAACAGSACPRQATSRSGPYRARGRRLGNTADLRRSLGEVRLPEALPDRGLRDSGVPGYRGAARPAPAQPSDIVDLVGADHFLSRPSLVETDAATTLGRMGWSACPCSKPKSIRAHSQKVAEPKSARKTLSNTAARRTRRPARPARRGGDEAGAHREAARRARPRRRRTGREEWAAAGRKPSPTGPAPSLSQRRQRATSSPHASFGKSSRSRSLCAIIELLSPASLELVICIEDQGGKHRQGR